MTLTKNFNNILVNTITTNSTTATFITNITTSNIVTTNFTGSNVLNTNLTSTNILNTNFTGSNILNTNLTTNSLIVNTNAKFNCNVSMSNFTVTGLNDPVALTDAATKNYVDNKLTAKNPVIVATTTAGTLATSFANGSVIDSITLTTGMRILVKNQATATENGIYTVNVSGAPTRTLDFATGSAQASSYTFVNKGTTNADTLFTCTNDTGSDIVGTNNLAFSQISGGLVNLAIGVSGILPVANGGTNATSLANITVGKATNINGGVAGQVLYQSASNTTDFITPGAVGTVLTSQGAGSAPIYQTVSGGSPILITFTPSILFFTGGSYTQQSGTYYYFPGGWWSMEIKISSTHTGSSNPSYPIRIIDCPVVATVKSPAIGKAYFTNIVVTGGASYGDVIATMDSNTGDVYFYRQNLSGSTPYTNLLITSDSISSPNSITVSMQGHVN